MCFIPQFHIIKPILVSKKVSSERQGAADPGKWHAVLAKQAVSQGKVWAG